MTVKAKVTVREMPSPDKISGYQLAEHLLSEGGVEALVRYAGNAETDWLELKAGMCLLPEDEKKGFTQADLNWNIAKDVIALMNTSGGALVIGIHDKTLNLVPLESNAPRHVIATRGIDGYIREVVRSNVWPNSLTWNYRGKILELADKQLPTDLISYQCHDYAGCDGGSGKVVVLLVKPVEKMRFIRVERKYSVLLARMRGDVGNTKPIYDFEEIEAYKKSREIATERYARIRDDFDAEQLKRRRLEEYDRFVKSGILGFDIERYRDSIMYYCMPHDDESEKEYNQHYKPPFPITEIFKKRLRLILQTAAPVLYRDHPDLYELASQGYDLIHTVKMGFEYWRDNASDEGISSKAKYVVDKLDELGYEMGGGGNFPSVADYVVDVLEYAEKQLKLQRGLTESGSRTAEAETHDGRGNKPQVSALTGAISGYALVEKILNYYGNEGVAKLLECTDHQETEFLELKTSYLLSEEDKQGGERQENLDWDIALALIAIANTAGGALIIGVGKDNRTLYPVEVKGDREAFLRTKICQALLPDQRVWTVRKAEGGKVKTEKWIADALPRFEARLYPYLDGVKSGNVVLILVEPQPRSRYITLENTNQGTKLLVQRKAGIGRVVACYDSAKFGTLDNERHIERGKYLSLLMRLVPDLNSSPIGRSSGVYRFRPVDGSVGKDIEDPLVRQTEGHRLCYDFKPGGQIGKYVVKERIGCGGMGVVYRVRHSSLGKEYALKAFKMESEDASMAKERFRAEAQVLMQLDHPGLPKVYDLDFDEETECYYLVQDLIVGKDGKPHELGGYVVNPDAADAQGLVRISSEMALKWLRQVCEIADYLHGKGVAHRDVTLKNLLIDADDNVMLTDLGIAKVMDPELRRMIDCQVTMTVTQTPSGDKGFWGTWRYLPPEVRNKRKEDIKPEATDVWAIGVCFFKLLTGEWFEVQQFEDYEWNKGKWGMLLRGMLKADSHGRLSCAAALDIIAQEDVPPHLPPSAAPSGSMPRLATRYDNLVAAFRRLLVPNSEGVLPIVGILRSPLPNIESPTMGGQFWWDTLCVVKGWKLQKNKFFKQIRILDDKNFRRAWGWRRGMERMLGCPVQPSPRYGRLVRILLWCFMSVALLVVCCYVIVTWWLTMRQ